MKPLTVNFIKSLELNPLDYDLEMIGYKKVNGQWVYDIAVNVPWDFALLEIFLQKVSELDYDCKINYSYTFTIASDEVIDLFKSWYLKRTSLWLSREIIGGGDQTIDLFIKEDDDIQTFTNLVNDFNLLLQTISYPFEIKIHQVQQVEEEAEEDFSLSEDEDDVEIDEEEDEYTEEVAPHEDEDAPVYVDQGIAASEKVTNLIDEKLEKNLEIMKKERALARKRREYPAIAIEDITANDVSVDIDGIVFSLDMRPTRKNGQIYIIGLAKNGHAINAKKFCFNADKTKEDDITKVVIGSNVRIKGQVQIDKYSSELTISIDFISLLPPPELRKETYDGPKKRIELHTHTKMSVMDGVGTVKGYLDLAENMGHKAIAFTDHGCVQAFPEIYQESKKHNVKVIYGAELYMIDTKPNFISNPSPILLSNATYTVFDLETTGLSERYDKIIEFGAIKVKNGMILDRINILINPGPDVKLSKKTLEITNITNEMLENEPQIGQVIDKILAFIGDSILVSHNAQFDYGFLNQALIGLGRPTLTNPVIDTLPLSRFLFPKSSRHNLAALARNLEIVYEKGKLHRADYDAEVLNSIWQAMMTKLFETNNNMRHIDLGSLVISNEIYKHLMPYHVVVLAKNQQGIKDLYELISLSHIEYLAEVPKIPRHILEQYRENLLISSACQNGEVFQTALTRSEERLVDVMKFYDYIEIQPPANYSNLLNLEKIESPARLNIFLKDIAKAARIAGKPLVVTGDVHYENPEDKIFRDVLISAKAVGKVPHALYPFERDDFPPYENPDQHYRTTEEMLDAFVNEGIFTLEEAKEYVIENTHLIANQIDNVKPIKDKLYTPYIENVDTLLRDVVFENAHKLYGNPLPQLVENRLNTELEGIIQNGYAVIYYLSYLIVKKATDEGYVVGSRGSVGSSFVATMAGITEVNPLIPHYRCPKCQYTDFHPDVEVKSGFDLPEKTCPVCGTKLIGDGQNIPFATFLGYKADKVPDIDLNFDRDFQAQAHQYVRDLIGDKNVYRAGTIETVKDKTAFGFAKGFYERLKVDVSLIPRAQIAYLAAGITEVKRTTGQHPGGIVVVPKGFTVYDFTPVQFPANDMDSDWQTTHFDYHAIHDNILKFDLLGHVDPLALRMMAKLTGVNIDDIPFGDRKVLSLFSSTKELKLKHNYLKETNGALGLPEFGTKLGRGLLNATKPKLFNELIIISGLSHGKGVWKDNAEKLIREGHTTLDGVFGCRDDIMTYLISKGIEPEVSFKVMESVRKGYRVPNDYVGRLYNNNVPDYFIESFNKIKYLFPRAHATAYVMMAFRVAYFKLYYPLEYYAVYFTVRSKQYEIKTMLSGPEAIRKRLIELETDLNIKEDVIKREIYKTLQIALEMEDRGISFTNIDLYRSDARDFLVDKDNPNKIIPPFSTIDGLGERTADTIIEARKNGPFISVEDLIERTKLNTQNIERLRDAGVLKDLPEANQLNLFDFL